MRARWRVLQRIDWVLLALVLLVNGALALDLTGVTRKIFPDAATRAVKDIRRRNSEAPALQAKREAMINELQGRHPWAGRYYGYGENQSVAPALGFIKGSYNGEIKELGNRIVQYIQNSSHKYSREFWIVPWGPRVYLIHADKMVDFISLINSGQEPRREMYGGPYLRENDWLQPATGRPLVPAAYHGLILKQSIRARITSVEPKRYKRGQEAIPMEASVVLDAGRSKGVFPGIIFYPSDKRRLDSIMIRSVSEHVSEGVAYSYIDEFLPRAGLTVSTLDERPPQEAGFGCGFGGGFDDSWQLHNGYGRGD